MKNQKWTLSNKTNIVRALVIAAFALGMISAQAFADKAPGITAMKNSWRGITPLRSTAEDVAQAVGVAIESPEDGPMGPFRVEDGEVSFSYVTPSLAKIYRAPRSMVGKVFTIYFKPSEQLARAEIKIAPAFKRCTEELGKSFYYYVSDAGIAYQFRRADDRLESIIYQPTRVEASRLAVSTECVF